MLNWKEELEWNSKKFIKAISVVLNNTVTTFIRNIKINSIMTVVLKVL